MLSRQIFKLTYFMRHLIFLFTIISSLTLNGQVIDTLVDVGGYNMHFNIITGEGTPILFEAGAGNDGSVWNNILENIHKVTGTTLITYDRSGFGKSELNPNITEDSGFGILNGIEELDKGLKILGLDDDIILVSHSYGGFYNALYASKHPQRVKQIILIDVVPNSFWNEKLLNIYHTDTILKKDFQQSMGMYYLAKNYRETAGKMENIEFPTNIPITNIYSENSFPNEPVDLVHNNRWLELHQDLGNNQPNMKNIVAHGSAHYIFRDNPGLIINAIIKSYSETLNKEQKFDMLNKGLDNAIQLSVEAKKVEMENLHSEDDLNEWGYTLMRNEELEKALEVFKLNIILYPESFNVYDSYGEILLKLERKDEAILMYEKSIELNPENENGKEMLQKIKHE